MELILLESHGIFKQGDTFKYIETFYKGKDELYHLMHIETGLNVTLYSRRLAPTILSKEELARIEAVNKS